MINITIEFFIIITGYLQGEVSVQRSVCMERCLYRAERCLYEDVPIWRGTCTERCLYRKEAVWKDGCMERRMYGEMPVQRSACMERWLYGEVPVWIVGCTEVPVQRGGGACMESWLYGEVPVWRSACMKKCLYGEAAVWRCGFCGSLQLVLALTSESSWILSISWCCSSNVVFLLLLPWRTF